MVLNIFLTGRDPYPDGRKKSRPPSPLFLQIIYIESPEGSFKIRNEHKAYLKFRFDNEKRSKRIVPYFFEVPNPFSPTPVLQGLQVGKDLFQK